MTFRVYNMRSQDDGQLSKFHFFKMNIDVGEKRRHWRTY